MDQIAGDMTGSTTEVPATMTMATKTMMNDEPEEEEKKNDLPIDSQVEGSKLSTQDATVA